MKNWTLAVLFRSSRSDRVMIVVQGWADQDHDQVGLAVLIIGGLVSMATNGFGNFESGLDSVCNKKQVL